MKKLLIFLSLFLLVSCNDISDKPVQKSEINSELKKEVKPQKIRVVATGDMLFHMPIVNSSRTSEGYDFKDIFSEIMPAVKDADIAVANFEGTVCPTRSLSGFPMFNFPEETLRDIKAVGFDAISTANNHSLDTGLEGVRSTIEISEKYGLKHFGSFIDEKKDLIIEKNGIKIGFLAYTDSLNGNDMLMKAAPNSINTMNEVKIKEDIQRLKQKCDFLIIYPHWGIEYMRTPNKRQIDLSDNFLRWGADAILGSHPHVLQSASKKADNKFVIYSMGNAISNQRERYLGRTDVETGVLVVLDIEKKEKAVLKNVKLMPTYVDILNVNNKRAYRIRFLEEAAAKELNSTFYKDKLKRAEDILNGAI